MKMGATIDIELINRLVGDRQAFSEFVYTPISIAGAELAERKQDLELERQVNKLLKDDIPEPLNEGSRVVHFRQLVSPNFEFQQLLMIAKNIGLRPLLMEYMDDIFTSINPIKRFLGKMRFTQKKGDSQVRIITKRIINFNNSQGMKIRDVETIWGQSLIEFHHELLEFKYPNSSGYIYDASTWFRKGGEERARKYYLKYLSLFVRNGILLENFVLEDKELDFIREVFLPAFIEVWRFTKKRPIIAALLPLATHNDNHWLSYPYDCIDFVKWKMDIKSQ
ncbi:MAG: hypothetical protein WCG83_05060 [Candidatus Peregrinibacteria bacterium]